MLHAPPERVGSAQLETRFCPSCNAGEITKPLRGPWPTACSDCKREAEAARKAGRPDRRPALYTAEALEDAASLAGQAHALAIEEAGGHIGSSFGRHVRLQDLGFAITGARGAA